LLLVKIKLAAPVKSNGNARIAVYSHIAQLSPQVIAP
jgi:hypothetical protein